MGLATYMGNRGLYMRQLQRFAETYQDFSALFASALADADAGAARRTAHSLRGIAGNLGAVQVQHASAALEQACKTGAGLQQFQALLEACVATLQPLINGLNDFGWVAETAVVEAPEDVDPERRSQLLDRLASQLHSGDPDASETLAELMPWFQSPHLQSSVRRVAKLIDEFDFEAAETELQSLLTKL